MSLKGLILYNVCVTDQAWGQDSFNVWYRAKLRSIKYNSAWKYIEKEKINNVDKIKKAWLILRTCSILKYIKIIF